MLCPLPCSMLVIGKICLDFFYHALHYSALSDLINVCSFVRGDNVHECFI